MKFTTLATTSALALAINTANAATELTLCVEKVANLNKATLVVKALNDDTDLADFTFKVLEKTSPTDVITAFGKGECNLIEFDAGKAWALAVGDATAFPIAQEGTGSYETQAVVKKSFMDAEKVKTYCDLVSSAHLPVKKWRACHTGFMKSAGWLSPMMTSLNCPNIPTECSTSTAPGTGQACHEKLFGDSCVPGMYADIAGTPMKTGQMCKQCGGVSPTCDAAVYSNYNGAAKGLLDGSCDVAFVKVPTIECGKVGAGEFCKSGATGNGGAYSGTAACLAAGNCDSKSVYAKKYTVPANTFVRLPGYSLVMPSHLMMANKMTKEQAAKLMTKLPTHWNTVESKTLTSVLGKKTIDVLGKDFVVSLDQVPFYYKKYKVIRPLNVLTVGAGVTVVDATVPASSGASSRVVAGVAGVAAIAALVFGI